MKLSTTHNRIGAVKPRVLRLVAVAFAVAAVAAPAAQAGGPDDRQDYRGTSPALTASGTSPDDRGNYRGTSPALTASGTSPDDRGNYRGSSDTLAPTGLGPDDRAFARGVHGIELASAPVEVRPHGFDRRYVVVGGTFGLTLALLGLGAMVIAQRRRSTPAPA